MGLGVRLLRGAGPVLGLLLLAAPAVLAQVLLRAQTFNTTPTVYCAFGDLSVSACFKSDRPWGLCITL